MKITVTTSLRIEKEDGDSTTIVETVRESAGGNPRFEAWESARVLVVSAERVLERMGGEEIARRRPLNSSGPDYAGRIYGEADGVPGLGMGRRDGLATAWEQGWKAAQKSPMTAPGGRPQGMNPYAGPR